jgi:opacity protein-like surface antigen
MTRYGSRAIVPLACALILIAPAASVASDVGAHLGYAKGRDADTGNGLVGGHLEIGIAPFLGIQGAVDYRLVEKSTINAGVTQGTLKVRSVPTTVTARLYLPGPVSPFAAVGAGWYHLVYDYSSNLEGLGASDHAETTFGWHVGGGVRVMVAPKVSVYGEGRAVFVRPDHALNQQVFDQVKSWDYDSVYFAGGVSLHL